MSIGFLALLDDAAALVKASAASLDDITVQVGRTTSKVSGIVIDDAAVTPKYVVGLDPKRELAIIYSIAKRSLINKLLFLGPAALMLGYFAPWLISPLLMLGGAYLCFEGYEKIHSIFVKHENEEAPVEAITPEELEKIRIKSAVNTDFILSAEIIAISYASVVDRDITTQIIVMSAIAVIITVAVYGFVALVVKADDIGLNMAKRSNPSVQRAGRAIVKIMPGFLQALSYIGTLAMLLVGAEIIAHGVPFLHHALELVKEIAGPSPFMAWAAQAFCAVLGGLTLGAAIERLLSIIKRLRGKVAH